MDCIFVLSLEDKTVNQYLFAVKPKAKILS